MIHEARSRRTSPFLIGLALLVVGILIGTVADPASWFRASSKVNTALVPSDLSPQLAPSTAPPSVPDNGLETLHLKLSDEAARTIQNVHDRALERGQIVQEAADTVPAALTHEGREYPVEVRIKGDLPDHVKSDKWSFRITLTEGKLFGMRTFSVQNPTTRGFIWEWLVHRAAQHENLIAPRSRFVNVTLNNNVLGVYFLEEHFSKEMLESQGRREGPIVLFDERSYWAVQLMNHSGGLALKVKLPEPLVPATYSTRAGVRVYGEKKLASVEALNRSLMSALEKIRELKDQLTQAGDYDRLLKLEALHRLRAETMEQALDAGQWAKAHALISLFQITHGLAWINLRLYYNPLTDRLEPILFDNMAHHVLVKDPVTFYPDPLVQGLMESGIYETDFFQWMGRYSDGTFLDQLFKKLEPEIRIIEAALMQEAKLPAPFRVDDMKQRLRSQQVYLKEVIHVSDPVNFFCTFEKAQGEGTTISGMLDVEAWASTRIPVVIEGFRFSNGSLVPARACAEGSVHARDDGVLLRGTGRPVNFRFPADARLANLSNIKEIKRTIRQGAKDRSPVRIDDIHAVYRLVPSGAVREELLRFHPHEAAWKLEKGRPDPVGLKEALDRHQCLSYDIEKDRLSVLRGTWEIEGDLVVPLGYTLHARGDTRLRFSENCALIASSPLVFEADEEKPIVLAARETSWNGIIVMNAHRRSTWRHVVVKDTRHLARAGWVTTGGTTFYRSPVTMEDTFFNGTAAEDGLNVFGCDLLMDRVTFARCASDSFDGDFVTGVIRNSVFRDGAADGLDLSGSDVLVQDCRFLDLGDKAVSVGEGTRCRIQGGTMERVSIGVAAKDEAEVEITGTTISEARNFAVAVYIKKPEYGPAKVKAGGLKTSDPFLVQTESELIVNGETIATRDLDVERLYDEQILGN